jgi:hypothetical protein
MSRAHWVTTAHDVRYEFEMTVQFETKDKPGIIQSVNLSERTIRDLRNRLIVIRHYSRNVSCGKLNIKRFTGTFEIRVRGEQSPCVVCGRAAPLDDGECPDCRH